MIIDAHVHIMPQYRLNGLSYWLGKSFSSHPMANQKTTKEKILSDLSQKGVKYIYNFVFPIKSKETQELNHFNYKFSKENQKIKVFGFGSVHVEDEDKKEIVDKCIFEYGFYGFKLHPYVQGFSPTDERLFSVYERLEELGKPINIHTGFDDFYPKKEKPITLSGIEGLIKKFPSLTFILPHMFYPRLEEALYLLETYNNVYIDTTNIYSAIIQDEQKGMNRDKLKEILVNTIKKWYKRIVFGSDYPCGMSDLNTIYSDFYSFGLDEKIKREIMFNTPYSLIIKENKIPS
jgi:hypothetical protein